METLFEQEELHFEPIGTAFDVDRIADRIGSLGFSFRDAIDPAVFVVAADAASRDTFAARRKTDPAAGFPYVLLIRVEPARVTVYQLVGGQFLDFSREFVAWLLAEYPCRITNEAGVELRWP